MSGEIKFRAFYKGVMIYRGLHDRNWYTTEGGGVVAKVAHPDDIYLPIMQLTGLRDKKGAPIFVGDVVTISDCLYTIIFDNGTFQLFNKESQQGRNPLCSERVRYMKIIGNIHQGFSLLDNDSK